MAGEQEMGSNRDVIRILYEVEERLNLKIASLDSDVDSKVSKEDLDAAIQQIVTAIAAIVPVPPAPEAVTAKLLYSIGGTMPGNVLAGVVGNTATPTFSEADPTGAAVAPTGPVVYASDNAAVTVDANTGIATLVSATAAGTPANVSALDTANGLTDSVAFTVSAAAPPVAVSASLSYTLNPSRRR